MMLERKLDNDTMKNFVSRVDSPADRRKIKQNIEL